MANTKRLWDSIEKKTRGTGTNMDEFVYLGDIEDSFKEIFGEDCLK